QTAGILREARGAQRICRQPRARPARSGARRLDDARQVPPPAEAEGHGAAPPPAAKLLGQLGCLILHRTITGVSLCPKQVKLLCTAISWVWRKGLRSPQMEAARHRPGP